MKEHSFNTATITTIGMFTAVLAVLSILQIPMPSGVPITLQTFAVALYWVPSTILSLLRSLFRQPFCWYLYRIW